MTTIYQVFEAWLAHEPARATRTPNIFTTGQYVYCHGKPIAGPAIKKVSILSDQDHARRWIETEYHLPNAIVDPSTQGWRWNAFYDHPTEWRVIAETTHARNYLRNFLAKTNLPRRRMQHYVYTPITIEPDTIYIVEPGDITIRLTSLHHNLNLR